MVMPARPVRLGVRSFDSQFEVALYCGSYGDNNDVRV